VADFNLGFNLEEEYIICKKKKKKKKKKKNPNTIELPVIASSFSVDISEEICIAAAKMGKHVLQYCFHRFIQ
jgi:hypothetical protein